MILQVNLGAAGNLFQGKTVSKASPVYGDGAFQADRSEI